MVDVLVIVDDEVELLVTVAIGTVEVVVVVVVVVVVLLHVPHITGQTRRVSAAIAKVTAVSLWQFFGCTTKHSTGSVMPPQ